MSMQGPVSPSTISNFDAMKSAHNAAITANEKIFPIFAKKLASKDTRDYINIAHKLAVWLGSEKAYYPAARPKIVELLEIALSNFMNSFTHHPAVLELAEMLRQLVQVIIPFRHLFLENQLQSRLQRIIYDTELSLSRVSRSAVHTDTSPQQSGTISIPPPMHTSPVHPQLTIPHVHDPQTSLSNMNRLLDTSVPMDALPASSKVEEAPSHAPPVAHTPSDLSENVSPSIPSKPQPKRARRAELSDELIARDLDWFKSNQHLTAANEDPNAPLPTTGEPSSVMVYEISNVPERSPSLKKKTARMVPSRRLPRRISSDATQESEYVASASSLPPAEDAKFIENVPVRMVVGGQSPSLTRTKDSREEEVLPPDTQLVPAPSNRSSNGAETPQVSHQAPSVEVPSVNGGASVSPRPPTPLPETMVKAVETTDDSNSDLGSENLLSENLQSESPSGIDSSLQQPPEVLQLRNLIIPPLVYSLELPLNLNFRIPLTSPRLPQDSETSGTERRFDGEMTIIHSTWGRSFTHTHLIDIGLNDNISADISMWINRKSRPSEAPLGVCISLACYRLPQFFDTIKPESEKQNIEMLTSQSSCTWPHLNRLFLHVNHKEKEIIITLSPPLFLTPDECVDISSLMKPGNNTLEIRQEGDLSDYLIVLHAHRPTRAQLAEMDVVKAADQRWRQFLDVLCAPVVPRDTEDGTPQGPLGIASV